MTPKPARVLAWLTFVIGIVVSVLGNVGHAASDGMQPGEWAGAAFWPVALLLSIEVLVRVRWQPEKRWTFARFLGLLVVSAVAAVLSYLHLRSLLIFWGYGKFQGSIGPLAVDGLMLIAASALLSISKERAVVQPVTAPVLAPDPAQVPATVTAPAVDANDTPSQQDAEIIRLANQINGSVTPPKPPKVQTSKTVTMDAAEEHAFQVWMNAPQGSKPSVRKLADMTGLSNSKVHRLINGTPSRDGWRQMESAR